MSDSPTIYLIDTCVLVNIRDVHSDSEEIWVKVRGEITSGRLKTVRHCFDELKRRFPPVFARLKDLRKDFLIADADIYTADVVSEIRAIHVAHPGLYDQLGTGNPADPFLIAAAKFKSGIVVTDEKSAGAGYKSRIPYVCTNRNVGWSAGVAYLRSIGCNV